MTDSPIHAILARLADDRVALRAAVDTVPPGDRARRPGPGRWSVADVLEHLALGGHEERHAAQVREIAAQLATSRGA